MSIETAKRKYAEIVVGHFAAAVFVFFRVFQCDDIVEVLLNNGPWVRGRVDKRRDGDGKRETTYDIELLDGGCYVRGVTATLPNGAPRIRSIGGRQDVI